MNKNYLNLKFGLVDIIANLHLSHATKIFITSYLAQPPFTR